MIGYVSLGLLGIFCLILILNVVRGLVKGVKKGLACLAAIILSVVIALVLTVSICTPANAVDILNAAGEVINEPEIAELLEIEEISAAIGSYAVMIVAPFFFTLSFIVVSLVVCLVFAIVVKFIPILRSARGAKNRLYGLLIGLVCGVIVGVVCLMPLVGTADLIATADGVITSEAADDEASAILHEVAEDEIINVLAIGCRPVYNSLASTRFDGDKVYLKDEVAALFSIVDTVGELEGDMSEYGEEQVAALNSIVDCIDSSPLFKNAVAGVLSNAASAWANGEEFMGAEKPAVDEMLDPVVDNLLLALAKSDKENIGNTLRTVSDILAIMIRSDILGGGEDVQMTSLLIRFGEVLDVMAKSDVLGEEFAADTLTTLMESDAVCGALGISAADGRALADKINGKALSENYSYTEAITAIAGTLDMLASSTNGEISKEDKTALSKELLTTITPESAEMLGSMVTPSMLESFGISSENSEAISSTVGSILSNMANYEASDDPDAVAREAEAVNTILDIALNGASVDGSLFSGAGGDGALGASAEEIVDLVMSSTVISDAIDEVVNLNGYNDNPLGIPELSEADAAELSSAIEAYYAAGGNDSEIASQLEALAAILNLDIELD